MPTTPTVSLAQGAGSVSPAGSKPTTEPSRWTSRSGGAPAGGHGHHVHALGRHRPRPSVPRIAGRSWRTQKPRAGLVPARAGSRTAAANSAQVHGAAVLDLLLPGRGERAGEVADGHDHVHLAAGEGLDRGARPAWRSASDRCSSETSTTVVVGGVDPVDQRLPGARDPRVARRRAGGGRAGPRPRTPGWAGPCRRRRTRPGRAAAGGWRASAAARTSCRSCAGRCAGRRVARASASQTADQRAGVHDAAGGGAASPGAPAGHR